MTETRNFVLRTPQVRTNALQAVRCAPPGWVVRLSPPTRTLEQNSALWGKLTDISKQIKWDGEYLKPIEFKDLFSAALRKQKVVRGVDGGLVFLGTRTSQMTVADMNDLLTLIDAFAAEKGVVWSNEPARENDPQNTPTLAPRSPDRRTRPSA